MGQSLVLNLDVLSTEPAFLLIALWCQLPLGERVLVQVYFKRCIVFGMVGGVNSTYTDHLWFLPQRLERQAMEYVT